jgi:LuxR family transcriptional regulator of spore coat protein
VKDDKEPRSAPFSPRNNLTSTEKEILELLAQGWTARETAGHVNLGIRTVERYIENLRLKMNARNTAHLIACAFSKGTLKVVRGVVRITN